MRNLCFTITVVQAFNFSYQHIIKSYTVAVWLKNANQQEVVSWKLKNKFQQQYEFLHINAFHSLFLSLYHSKAKTLYQQVWVPYFSLGKNNVINYVQIHCIISQL